MFGKAVVHDMISRSAENPADRRLFLKTAGVAGLGVIGAGAVTAMTASEADAAGGISDGAILNFALNLEYLEAEFYNQAAFGKGLAPNMTSGKGAHGRSTGGHKVPFKTKAIENYAKEIAKDELDHVNFLRYALGSAKVASPELDLVKSFTAAGRAAGVVGKNEQFDPFKDEDSFLLGAFLFEDVGVTAYKGAAPLITNKTYLGAAAGILAVEAYHAGIVRTSLYQKGLYGKVKQLSDARNSLDGRSKDDFGIGNKSSANLVPTDANGLAFSRTPANVLNIVYLTPDKATRGGFYPRGVNGEIHVSGKH